MQEIFDEFREAEDMSLNELRTLRLKIKLKDLYEIK